jgi:hypothetical protein
MSPTFDVFTVVDRDQNKKPFWIKIGAAWEHEARRGYNVTLDALPVNGKLVLIEQKEGDESTPIRSARSAAMSKASSPDPAPHSRCCLPEM